MDSMSKKQTQIIDHDLYLSLVEENKQLRLMLCEVSSVGVSMMYHTHKSDCSHFTRDFLKSIVSMAHDIEAQRVHSIYEKAYSVATSPGVLEQFYSVMKRTSA